MHPTRSTVQRGFTLIQISILLTVAALVMVALLPSSRSKPTLDNATTVTMNCLLTAMREYESVNSDLPCPADASLPNGIAAVAR